MGARIVRVWIAAATLAVMACDAGSESDDDDDTVGACALEVATAAAVARCIPDGDWLYQLSPHSLRPTSVDLVATADITFRSEHVAVPEPCSDCLDHVRFQSSVPGATLADPAGDDYLVQFRRVDIASGTRFRLRVHSVSEFPFFPVVLPTVQFLPDSQTTCDTGALRCDDDAVCYTLAQTCYQCERRGGPACACVDDQNEPYAEGADCEYAISFDQLESGTCQSGTCTP
jgi:hypothetical protein